jgi:hypothetical protein
MVSSPAIPRGGYFKNSSYITYTRCRFEVYVYTSLAMQDSEARGTLVVWPMLAAVAFFGLFVKRRCRPRTETL